ncbi:DUF4283 domain-containing protein, partial [Cephalotus follicularis]
NCESAISPMWIGLPKLPIHFFSTSSIFSIACTVGHPLKVDAATASLSRPSMACMCVEVDIRKLLPKCVWIGTGVYVGFWQEVVCENVSKYCKPCSRQGHHKEICKLI